MRIKSLTKPKFRTYTFSLDKKGDLSAHNFNLIMTDGEIRSGAMVKKIDIPYPESLSIKKIFHVGERYFLQTKTNELYMLNGQVWENIAQVGDNLYITECSVGGSSLIAIGFDDGGFFIDQTGSILQADLPNGDCSVFYAGMLFVAKGNLLNFSKLLCVEDFSLGLNNGGFVKTEVNDGNILALVPMENCLVVFCEKGVYELTAVGERTDYKLIRQNVSISAEQGSVGYLGDKIFFINNGKLCYFKSGVVNSVDCDVFEDFYFDGQSTVSGGVYIAKIKGISNRVKKLLYFDTNGFESSIIDLNVSQTASEGILLSGTQFFGVSEKHNLNNDFFWESKLLDLGFSEKKDLLYFGAYSDGEVKVSITGDTIKKTFELKKGYNERLLNIPSYGFTLSFFASGNFFKVKDIKIKYRIRGE